MRAPVIGLDLLAPFEEKLFLFLKEFPFDIGGGFVQLVAQGRGVGQDGINGAGKIEVGGAIGGAFALAAAAR